MSVRIRQAQNVMNEVKVALMKNSLEVERFLFVAIDETVKDFHSSV